jgi:hypothetical protein
MKIPETSASLQILQQTVAEQVQFCYCMTADRLKEAFPRSLTDLPAASTVLLLHDG